jgi:hypothetical protein
LNFLSGILLCSALFSHRGRKSEQSPRQMTLLAPAKPEGDSDPQLSPTIQMYSFCFKNHTRLWATCPTTLRYRPLSGSSRRMSCWCTMCALAMAITP